MVDFVVLQTSVPDYRKKFFTLLRKKYEGNLTIYTGCSYFEPSVKTDYSIDGLKQLKNIYLLDRRFLFQIGMWRSAIKADILAVEMNPRIISTWLLLIIRRVLFKKTICWGHAWSKKGAGSKSDFVRNIMRSMAASIICYTKTQADELKKYMSGKNIYYAPNSVYYSDEMTSDRASTCNEIIYVGRLTKAKKPELLIRAFKKIHKQIPRAKLTIIGDGEERESLLNLVKDSGLEKKINLPGHIGDYEQLKKYYAKAFVSVSPGYIGLSVTQSFGFGVPMIVSKDENHSPEIECVIEGENAKFFKTDDIQDFSDNLYKFYKEKSKWLKKRDKIASFCRERYSVEAMVDGFLKGTIF